MIKKIIVIIITTFTLVSNLHAGSDGELILKKNEPSEIKDCSETFNKASFALNQGLDKVIFKPVASVYRLMPSPVKTGVSNSLNNLSNLVTVPNNLLQGEFALAGINAGRFVINTTIGLGGFIDVASKIGLQRHEEDFGQTLAVWGVGQGPYIMLPVLGPSTLRDTLGRPVSSYLSVTFHMTETDVNIALKGIDAIETREKLLGIETLLSGDKYSFVKDAYIQSMYYEIKDGTDVEDEFIDDMDDFLIDE